MERLKGTLLPMAMSIVVALGCSKNKEGAESGNGAIPALLLAVESSAEVAYDKALAGVPTDVRTAAEAIDRDWRSFRSQAIADGASGGAITAVDASTSRFLSMSAVSTGNVPLARTANAISANMDQLFDLYDSKVPTSILRLDYLGREIALDGRQGNFTGGLAHLKQMNSLWSGLRPDIVAKDTTVSAAVDNVFTRLADALVRNDATATETEANSFLEEVDLLEGLFQ